MRGSPPASPTSSACRRCRRWPGSPALSVAVRAQLKLAAEPAPTACVRRKRLITQRVPSLDKPQPSREGPPAGRAAPVGGLWTCPQTGRHQRAPRRFTPPSGKLPDRRVGGGPPVRHRRCPIGCRPAASAGWWPPWCWSGWRWRSSPAACAAPRWRSPWSMTRWCAGWPAWSGRVRSQHCGAWRASVPGGCCTRCCTGWCWRCWCCGAGGRPGRGSGSATWSAAR
jgi:hypothetical protein